MILFSQNPDTFSVEEISALEPETSGEHLYVTFRRKGLSTPFMAENLRRILKIKEEEIGYAGHKDKLSTAVQTFSLPRRLEEKIIRAFASLGAEIITSYPNTTKLRMGELLGNRFSILLSFEEPGDVDDLQTNLDRVKEIGLANFYGPQRLSDKDSFETGRKIFLNQLPKGGNRRRRFFVSVFQSHIFNFFLNKRIESGLYPGPLPGDLLLDPISDREFFFKEMTADLQKKLSSLEVHFTGPIIGSKMMLPRDKAFDFEKETIIEYGVPFETLIHARVPGARRAARIKVGDLRMDKIDQNRIALSFSLPKGSYATTLLKECGVRLMEEEKHR
jgi:tRNA pseudouridine13 synthase